MAGAVNDQEYDDLKTFINRRLADWKETLGLALWEIRASYHRTPWEGAESPNQSCLMDINARWEYLEASLRINVHAIWERGMGHDEIDHTLVHELMHCHLSELRCLVDYDKFDHHIEHEERVVSTLTTVVFRAVEAGRNLVQIAAPEAVA